MTDTQRSRQANQTKLKTIIHNFFANIFIKEVNLILYDDSKNNLHTKNNIASIFLDDFIVCYAEDVSIATMAYLNCTNLFICSVSGEKA